MARVVLSGAVLAGFALAGCIGAAEIPSTSEPITLEMVVFPDQGYERLVDEWMAEHPGVNVVITERRFDQHHDWLFSQLEDGSPAGDLASVASGYSFRARLNPSQFVDLRRFDADELSDLYLDWRWDHGVASDGSIIGLPRDVGGLAVAYRIDLFEAAGFPTDRAAVADLWPTWDALIDTGRVYREQTGEAFIDDAGSLFEARLNQIPSDRFYNADNALVAATSDGLKTAWDFAVSASDAGITMNVPAFTAEWEASLQASRSAPRFAVVLAPAWMLPTIKAKAPDTHGLWDITPIPNKEFGGNWGGSELVVPATSAHPELAFDLARSLLGHAGQRSSFLQSGQYPSISALYDEPAVADLTDPFFNDAPVGEIFGDSAHRMRPARYGLFEREIMAIFRGAVNDYNSIGAKDPAAADTAFRAAVKKAESFGG